MDETDGETVKDVDDIRLPVNLNSNTPVEGNRIFLACCESNWPVVRGIVFANVDDTLSLDVGGRRLLTPSRCG